jgi:hypothetical protein
MIPLEAIESRIFVLRGHRVMLDRDLAELYGVQTKALNQAVKRNSDRFPEDFMFKLTMEEAALSLASRSQIVTLNRGQNVKYAPHVFTEQRAVMLANVLKSPVAIRASIQVVRAFVRLVRCWLQTKTWPARSKRLSERWANTTAISKASSVSSSNCSCRHLRPRNGRSVLYQAPRHGRTDDAVAGG